MAHASPRRRNRAAAALLAALPIALVGHPLAAQSYPVVQPVPPPATGELSAALQRLARNPADFEALLTAGQASLTLGDVDAAIGFFSRAEALRAGDPRIKAGLASANLRAGRPIEALQLFEQAQAAGALPGSLAKDRGLAFDLVGDNTSAQIQYRLALQYGRDDEVLRRLGLSQAIAGDGKGFEATLLPLLQRRDLAAYRARAFGLAILGQEQEAKSIVEAVMPRDLAARMTPYLGYMPRLTRAQQAAAANLGNFPRAAQIGRDDPRLAQYAGPAAAAPRPAGDSRLAPAGEPLGPRAAVGGGRAERARPGAARARSLRPSLPSARGEIGTLASAPTPAPTSVRRSEPPRAPASPPPGPPPSTPPPAPPPSPPPPAAAPAQATPAMALTPPAAASAAVVVAALPAPETPAAGSVAGSAASPPASSPVTIVAAASAATPAGPPEPANLADAFAEFASAAAVQPAAGAVDITTIKPRREVAKPPPPPPSPPPAKPKSPSRVWVQVATGKDPAALAFDWRRLARKAPALLAKRSAYTAKWGETRRLLTGPVDSAQAASKLVADLKKAGIDAFAFTSADGEEVAPLG